MACNVAFDKRISPESIKAMAEIWSEDLWDEVRDQPLKVFQDVMRKVRKSCERFPVERDVIKMFEYCRVDPKKDFSALTSGAREAVE